MKDEERVKQLTVDQLAERADRSPYWEQLVANEGLRRIRLKAKRHAQRARGDLP
jgi:hypothetical protein